MTRVFDFFVSMLGLLILLPFFILISCLSAIDDGLPIFYLQERIGLEGRKFKLVKFRTMRNDAHRKGLLTVGSRDSRITRLGYFLRKYKLDELPQLVNVLKGDMALVGPRPEVEKYVLLYNESQRKVLSVKPGITDMASIEYIDENELLAKSDDPEKTYIEEIMPHKIEINLSYIRERSLAKDVGVLIRTAARIVR
jgi:lipopolysaccharide/colanic/teichoic acid biosynthesis glycosyltransferase